MTHLAGDNYLHFKYPKMLSFSIDHTQDNNSFNSKQPKRSGLSFSSWLWSQLESIQWPVSIKIYGGISSARGLLLGKVLLTVASTVCAIVLVLLVCSRDLGLHTAHIQASLWLEVRTQPEVHGTHFPALEVMHPGEPQLLKSAPVKLIKMLAFIFWWFHLCLFLCSNSYSFVPKHFSRSQCWYLFRTESFNDVNKIKQKTSEILAS